MHRTAARALAAVSLVVALAGCTGPGSSPQPTLTAGPGGDPSPVASPTAPTETPLPSAVPEPSASPVAQASQDPDPCEYRPDSGVVDPLPPGSAVTVVVNELNLRAGPCTAAATVATFQEGRVFLIRDTPYGPVKADGYSWYQVLLAPNSYPPGAQLPPLPDNPIPYGIDTLGGWIAVDDGELPYVAPIAPRCPTTVDLENVAGMLPAERLACFDGPIVVEGTYGCGGCGGTGGPDATPRWLAETFEIPMRVRWGDDVEHYPVGVHFRPSGPTPPAEGSIIRATLVLDVPAAQGCSFVWRIEDPDFTVPEAYAVSWCRERFVVDSYEVMGTDPEYPG